MRSSSSWIPGEKQTPAVWATDQPNQVALLVSLASFPLKCLCCCLRHPSSSEMSSGLSSVSLLPSVLHSLCISPPGLHGPLKPLLLHRRNSDSATQRNSWLNPYLDVFERTPWLPSHPPSLVSVYQKCDTTRLPNGRRQMKYLCLDMTGQCGVHVEGHPRFKQALNVLDGWFFGVY